MSETTKREPGEIVELRKRLEQREAMASVQSTYRKRRADRRARDRQAHIRRRAALSGELARTRSEVDQSGEARAQRVTGTRTLALCLLLPVMIAFGAWSAAGVQAGMVAMLGLDPDSAAAAMAWAVEPALLGIVAGVILIRARLQSAGGDLDERATKVEFGALAISIVLNMAGHWPTEVTGSAVAALAGHALGPIGAAGAAYLIAVVQDGVRDADPWILADGSRAPSLAESSPGSVDEDQRDAEDQAEREPRDVVIAPGVRVRVGGARADGYVVPSANSIILPIECAQRAQESVRVLAEGQAALAQLEDWRARDRASTARTRMHTEASVAATGGAPRALPYSSRTRPDQHANTPAHTKVPRARTASEPVRVQPTAERTDVVTERLPGATLAKKQQGARTRERIAAHTAAHPAHTPDQIAAHVGVSASTVRRHQADMRAQEHTPA